MTIERNTIFRQPLPSLVIINDGIRAEAFSTMNGARAACSATTQATKPYKSGSDQPQCSSRSPHSCHVWS
jgi:hypothetical protein